MKFLALVGLLFAVGCRGASTVDPRPMPDDGVLAGELVAMGKAEQDLRFEVIGRGGEPDLAQAQELEAIDQENTRRLIEIVESYGWPTKSRVGAKAAGAAWLILQHSPDYAFQVRMLPEVERLMQAGEVRGQEYALLYDRVQMQAGKPQRYGSQFVTRDGVMHMYAVEDPLHLDQRRASVGLGSIADYRKRLEEMYRVRTEL